MIETKDIKGDKMEEDNAATVIIVVFSIALILLGFTIGKVTTVNSSETHETIIKHNCGEYNSKTGIFQFVK